MSKVYVITEGEYSNYRIVGVTLNRKAAEQYCKNVKRVSKSWESVPIIEEYELDAFGDGSEWRRIYYCHIRKQDGRIEGGREGSYRSQSDARAPCEVAYPPNHILAESTKSKAHARKLAVEARQAWLRKQTEVTE